MISLVTFSNVGGSGVLLGLLWSYPTDIRNLWRLTFHIERSLMMK